MLCWQKTWIGSQPINSRTIYPYFDIWDWASWGSIGGTAPNHRGMGWCFEVGSCGQHDLIGAAGLLCCLRHCGSPPPLEETGKCCWGLRLYYTLPRSAFLLDRSNHIRWVLFVSQKWELLWGVLQGSPLSPIIFRIYIILLLCLIRASGLQFHSHAYRLTALSACNQYLSWLWGAVWIS